MASSLIPSTCSPCSGTHDRPMLGTLPGSSRLSDQAISPFSRRNVVLYTCEHRRVLSFEISMRRGHPPPLNCCQPPYTPPSGEVNGPREAEKVADVCGKNKSPFERRARTTPQTSAKFMRS